MMTYTQVKASDPSIRRIKDASFPEYRGRKYRVGVMNPEYPYDITSDGYWDGGSRTYRTIIDLATMRSIRVPDSHPCFNRENVERWGGPDGKGLMPTPGIAVVEHVYFCGKDLGIRILVHPADMPKLITQ